MDLPNRPREERPKDEKKVEQVTTGKVIQRKPSLGKKFRQTFFGGDAQSAGQYIFTQILVPALKDTFSDMVRQYLDQLMWGGSRSSSQRSGSPSSSTSSYTAYNRVSNPPWKQEQRREPSHRARATHSFNEIVLATRTEANEVLERLYDLIGEYNQASVADLYNLVGITPQFTDERWGWTHIRDAGVTHGRDGYLLDLPRPEQLD